MRGLKPNNMEYITNKKSMYAPVLIARHGELIWRVTLELFIEVREAVRLGCGLPLDTMRLKRSITIGRELK